jgi:hypothetical protein
MIPLMLYYSIYPITNIIEDEQSMKQTKSKKQDKTIIGDQWNGNDAPPELSCSWCNRDLVRLSDRNNQGESWFCRNCQIPFDPAETQIRKKSKLEMQRTEIEPDICSVGGSPNVSLRKQVEVRGGFKVLQDKGLKITNYKTTEKE